MRPYISTAVKVHLDSARDLPELPASFKDVASSKDIAPPGVAYSGEEESWTAAKWVSSLPVAEPIASAILHRIPPGSRPSNELDHLRSLGSSRQGLTAIRELLRQGGVIDSLADAIWESAQSLAEAEPVTGLELQEKFLHLSQPPTYYLLLLITTYHLLLMNLLQPTMVYGLQLTNGEPLQLATCDVRHLSH